MSENEELEQTVFSELETILDPELGIDIVNLGLVYRVSVDENKHCEIDITLTTPACPLTGDIEAEIVNRLSGIVDELKVNWVFDPPWSMDKISEEGKDMLRSIGLVL
jgi:metal-sulfur cluster biosynthetic enzyme